MYKFTMKTRSDGQDEASCDGLVAISRNGASCKLARMMVAEGIEDGPVVLMSGDTVSMEFSGLYWLQGKLTRKETQDLTWLTLCRFLAYEFLCCNHLSI